MSGEEAILELRAAAHRQDPEQLARAAHASSKALRITCASTDSGYSADVETRARERWPQRLSEELKMISASSSASRSNCARCSTSSGNGRRASYSPSGLNSLGLSEPPPKNFSISATRNFAGLGLDGRQAVFVEQHGLVLEPALPASLETFS